MIDEQIYNTATAQGIPPILATLIVAQARHETANYTSNAFRSCNNLFGYKYVGQNLSTGPCITSSEGNSYAKYASVADSVKELTAWIKRRQAENKFPANLNSITTPEQYATLLKNSGYYGAPIREYVNGLIFWLQKLGEVATSKESSFAIVVLLAIAVLIWRKRFF